MTEVPISSFVTVAFLSIAIALAHCDALIVNRVSVWRRPDVGCAPQSSAAAAVHRFAVVTEAHCVMTADEKLPTGALVAQFDHLARTCSVFIFQSVCRSLTTGKWPSCSVLFRFPIDHRLISAKLSNLWLAGGVSRLENLVCQADEDTNRLHPVAVQWSSEGAVFDGSAAYAVLNKSSISFTTGLTWLLRLKRQPQVQPFFEFIECSTLGSNASYGVHMWEFNSPRQLYVRCDSVTGISLPSIRTSVNQLSASPDHWINIGLASTSNGSSYDLFLDNAFLSKSSLTITQGYVNTPNRLCAYVGMRVSTPSANSMFNGTLRVLAFANSSMSEDEMKDFFAQLK